MDEKSLEYFNKTVISTPKPTASSTVDRRSIQRKERIRYNGENSLRLMEEDVNSSGNLSSISFNLQQQRELASNSLYRANKVASIPSKYLRSVPAESATHLNFSCESTISESDLLKTPVNTSTPRNSVECPSLGDSLTHLSLKIKNTDITLDNFVSEFQKAMNSQCDVPSDMFMPAEDADSMLLADERSWQMKEALPVQEEQFSNLEQSVGKMSLGEFFRCRSDTLSDLSCAKSPVKNKKPIPLIDVSNNTIEHSNVEINDNISLSVSAIQKFIAETEDTPRKATNQLLFKQEDKSINSLMNETDTHPSLPVSKNSSYTSDHSNNDVMHCLIDKENVDTMNIRSSQNNSSPSSTRNSSRASSRASSTLTSLPDGKLPIDTTKCDLIWGCIKLGKSITQDFIIRNRSPKRLILQLSVSGQEYKIMKDNRVDGEALSSLKIILHPHESKTILISFIPTRIGAAIDEILFTSVEPKQQQSKKQCVRLFGYGGYGKVEFANLTRDTTGRFWLSLGNVDSHSSAFEVKNTGVLPTFVNIAFNSKKFTNVKVAPNFFVLIPGEQREIAITYQLSAEDYKTLQNSLGGTVIMDLGSLVITSGTEVDRSRLRRLCRKCVEAGTSLNSLCNILKEKLEDEIMPPDLLKFRESTDRMKDILKLFTCHEVTVTVERDPDQTIMPQYSDESGLFQSLYQDTIVAHESTISNSCRLEPSVIFLTPPSKVSDYLFFSSATDKKLRFEISSPKELEVNPREGELLPNGECIITLTYQVITECEKKQFKVLVSVENEVFEAIVKVIPIHQIRS